MNDRDYMKRAMDLAKKGRGRVSPNPLVGALLVKDGKIIGEGYHRAYGKYHAERDAISRATEDVAGATLYCNLEPCSHYGKQPPCADLLIEKKIKRVVISNLDPNPKVSSIDKLREAGIEVDVGLLADKGKRLNEVFFFNMEHKRPLVALKYAMTLDGKIASGKYDSKWISNDKSRKFVHKLRHRYDAILVGKNTAMTDNPRLTARIKGGVDPIRIIVDTNLDIDPKLEIFKENTDGKTYLATTSSKERREVNAGIIRCKDKDGRVDLEDLLDRLYDMNISSVLVEGGSLINNAFLEAGLVDKIYEFISPKVISGKDSRSPFIGRGVDEIKDAYKFEIKKVKTFGEDIMIEANNVYRNS
ncbi:MAG: bifunctional diaminohydroxyphosphoribosylaminopyrimidine deaminase/5-amino-6-(5-phosphoribosylamino)uracil reductase RibD [Anaerococcus sp.]|nr:bifunctional diaminohydroxyphosphoribosylaminopyrimidine deaminase/5-amino-6-(5-phosphoribosylamino)uracil reductase RibD [Anaerococcus sp.]